MKDSFHISAFSSKIINMILIELIVKKERLGALSCRIKKIAHPDFSIR